MALNLTIGLDGGEGLGAIVVFTGLSHPMLMHPAIYGEPALTAQAFYYLDDLGAMGQLSFAEGEEELSTAAVEYLVDNYLFAYTRANPEARISFKLLESTFWEEDRSDFCRGVDRNRTRALALDVHNDSSVLSVEALDKNALVDLQDWNIGVNHVIECMHVYMGQLDKALSQKVYARIAPNEEHDGYAGKLRVIRPDYGLLDFDQASALSDLGLHCIPAGATTLRLASSAYADTLTCLPIKRVDTRQQYTPILLSHWFAAIRERNPLRAFVSFYNVLEYYFEEAPLQLHRPASGERDQLGCVIELLVTETQLVDLIGSLPIADQSRMRASMATSTVVSIAGVNDTVGALRAEVARWLYDIRCAIVHSKKTRKGQPTPAFEPYTSASVAVNLAIPVIRWLAVACMEKDAEYTGTNPNIGAIDDGQL